MRKVSWTQSRNEPLYSISKLRVGKVLTVHNHGLRRSSIMMVLRIILKGILKVYFRLIISSLMRSVDKFWKACNKI